jgi:hypothetical protein
MRCLEKPVVKQTACERVEAMGHRSEGEHLSSGEERKNVEDEFVGEGIKVACIRIVVGRRLRLRRRSGS